MQIWISSSKYDVLRSNVSLETGSAVTVQSCRAWAEVCCTSSNMPLSSAVTAAPAFSTAAALSAAMLEIATLSSLAD
ncbi:hypothetical protein PBY51_024029 [Eleginops maclovinus]|uniref:Uncharacterized protein n=1 Tax=Eleginops maclovinus TaxID=56733 RepID=A0AAN7XYU3_ELEMC|nr:hypothetical protein PBY51_024029 [Eleginops maclovinus]